MWDRFGLARNCDSTNLLVLWPLRPPWGRSPTCQGAVGAELHKSATCLASAATSPAQHRYAASKPAYPEYHHVARSPLYVRPVFQILSITYIAQWGRFPLGPC